MVAWDQGCLMHFLSKGENSNLLSHLSALIHQLPSHQMGLKLPFGFWRVVGKVGLITCHEVRAW